MARLIEERGTNMFYRASNDLVRNVLAGINIQVIFTFPLFLIGISTGCYIHITYPVINQRYNIVQYRIFIIDQRYSNEAIWETKKRKK